MALPSKFAFRLHAGLAASCCALLLAGCGTSTTGGSAGSTPILAPAVSLSPTSLAFTGIATGTSATLDVILTNTGAGTLTGLAITTTGPGTLGGTAVFTSTSTCGSTLAAAATCTISVSFTPTAVASYTGTVSIADNATGAPQTVALTATGIAPVISCKPSPAPVTAPPTPPTTASLAGTSMNVTVLAGLQPVSGASVQLYAAGKTGLGSAPTALGAALTTTSAGTVTIPTGYTCPATNSQLYVVAKGGKVGAASTANASLALMTALGACNQQTTGEAVAVNEVTTTAAAYSLAQFMAAGGAVGASSTNVTGIANAFVTAANLANPALGSSPGSTFPSNGNSPAAKINTVANLLNSCTAQTTSSSCTQLFAATPNSAGVVPTNTLDAALNLARNPGANIAARYTQSLASTAFSPAVTAAPADWTMAVTFSGGGMNSPSGIGVDSGGNVRVANYFNVASAFSPTGAALYPTGVTGLGLNNSYGLAVDASDNAWIPNEQSKYAVNTGFGSVSVLNLAGASQAGTTGYSAGGLNYPIAVAIDPNTTAWVVDYGNSHLTLLSATGTPLSGTTGYTTPLFAFPVAVAIDGNHFGWIANQSSNTVTKVAPDGSSFTNYNCCTGASAVAVDQQNNVWVANFYGNSVSQIDSCGNVLSTGYTAGKTLDHPQAVAVDGVGNVWVANFRQPYISELAGSTTTTPGAAISPPGGYGSDSQLLEAYALSISASGDLWVTNFGSNTITQFVGLAVPVRTPLLSTPQLP